MGDGAPARGFADAVVAAVARSGPLCAGIDPSPALLAQWDLPDSAEGLRSFGLRCVEAFAGAVPVVKPQVAFFERWGSAGIGALEAVMVAARKAGLLVIADAKRGDIGSTMEASPAWLDPASPLAADAVTLVPYLGIGALRPALELAAASGRGAIVVVRGRTPRAGPSRRRPCRRVRAEDSRARRWRTRFSSRLPTSTGEVWPCLAPSEPWWARPFSPRDSNSPGSEASFWLRASERREGRSRTRPACSPAAVGTPCWPTCRARYCRPDRTSVRCEAKARATTEELAGSLGSLG